MSIIAPTYDQVLELPSQVDRTVPPEFIDENGHMNIGRYLELGGTALWQRCLTDLGMPEDYITVRGLSTFTAEHHLTYLSEILQDEHVSVHTRLVDRSDKVLHALSLVVNRTQQRLACVMETTVVHMDMTTRRPTSFPEDVVERLDAGLKRDDLAWPAPVTGSMGIRRSS